MRYEMGWREVFVWLAFVGVFVLVAMPLTFSGLDENPTFTAIELGADLPLLTFCLVAFLVRRHQAQQPYERRLWTLLTTSWACWAAIRVSNLAIPESLYWTPAYGVIVDVLYVGFYLFLLLAFKLKRREYGEVLPTVSVCLFALGLLVYVAGIPCAYNPEAYKSWIPSLTLYTFLDVCVLVFLIAYRRSCGSPALRRLAGGFAAATAIWCVADALELSLYSGHTNGVLFERDGALWLLPHVIVFGAAMSRRTVVTDPIPSPSVSDAPWTTPWYGRLLSMSLLAIALPVLHSVAYALDVMDEASREARELWSLVLLVTLGGLAAFYERYLRRENARLTRNHQEVKEQLELSQRMEAVGRLAGGIAHDFNNLLQVIESCSYLLQEDVEGDPNQKKLVEAIRHASSRASGLTDQLLTVSRRQDIEPEIIDFNKAVCGGGEMLRMVLGESIDLEIDLQDDIGAVLVDPGQFKDLILNLGLNARDAMPEGGILKLATSRDTLVLPEGREESPYAVLSIRDNGCGMNEQVRAHIFEPFFTTKERGKGTGLGLSMIYGFVKQSRGHITVESRPEQGSTFRIWLPLADQTTELERTPHFSSDNLTGRETVLVVEDEGPVREVLCMMLRECGYTVLQASNGRGALELMESLGAPLDLVLTDVVMPEMDGPALAERLRQNFPGTKLLFMSGFDGGALERHQDLFRESVVLRKPFSRETLARSLRQCLEAS